MMNPQQYADVGRVITGWGGMQTDTIRWCIKQTTLLVDTTSDIE